MTNGLNFDTDDIASLALCAWKEARGEGAEGMTAVMYVVTHRACVWYKGSIHAAIYAKNQFTSMSVPNDREFNLQPSPDDPQFAYCEAVAHDVLTDTQEVEDPTGGALYYANLNEVTSGWFVEKIVNDPANHPQTAVIGKQTFFR